MNPVRGTRAQHGSFHFDIPQTVILLVHDLWRCISLKKKNIYREVSPMNRVYSQLEMVVFCFGITVGRTFFVIIPQNIIMHGDLLLLLWIIHAPLLVMSASCFAEMAALYPAIGANYHYCYIILCEFIAFLVGWNMLFAFSSVTMITCSSLSKFIDHIVLSDWLKSSMSFMDGKALWFFCIEGYVDILFPIITISLACQAVSAVRFSKVIFNILACIIAIIIIVSIIIFGIHMDFRNFEIESTEDKEKLYDVFYASQSALIGYEMLGVLGEEAKEPFKTIPKSIMQSSVLLLVVYVLFSFTLAFGVTNLNVKLDDRDPLGGLFDFVGMQRISWLAKLGTAAALWCSSYGSMFITIRILYVMSRDGLIFRLFSKIDRFTVSPAIPAILLGIMLGLIGMFITLANEIAFFSYFFAKIMTSVCLLVTRYRCEKSDYKEDQKDSRWFLINSPQSKEEPTDVTHRLSMLLIYNIVVSGLSSIYCVVLIYISKPEGFQILCFLSMACFICFIIFLNCQPTNNRSYLSVYVGGVPFLPIAAICADFFSAVLLCKHTWLWGLIWTALGIVFYFSYSIFMSEENRNLYSDGSRWTPMETGKSFDPKSVKKKALFSIKSDSDLSVL